MLAAPLPVPLPVALPVGLVAVLIVLLPVPVAPELAPWAAAVPVPVGVVETLLTVEEVCSRRPPDAEEVDLVAVALAVLEEDEEPLPELALLVPQTPLDIMLV